MNATLQNAVNLVYNKQKFHEYFNVFFKHVATAAIFTNKNTTEFLIKPNIDWSVKSKHFFVSSVYHVFLCEIIGHMSSVDN